VSDWIRVEKQGRVAVLTVNNPDRRNALSVELSAALVEAVANCENDPSIGAVVVTGTGPAFCAGADLTELGEAREAGLRAIYAGFLAVADCALPTVAAVNGAAVGAGLNLALACDLRLAGPTARFDARFLRLGIHPGGGMTWMLHRLVGPQVARSMALFGQVLDAAEAVRVGLALRTAVDVVAEATATAEIAAGAPKELVIETKATMLATSVLTDHATAVEAELVPQLASMERPAFAELLGAMRTRIRK
jgi:enoyl-CoA hydratase